MTATRRELGRKQQRAVEALLVGASDQQAATAAQVSRKTIIRWRNSCPEFIQALSAARGELLQRTMARLHAATTVAVRALEEVAKDTAHPSPRISAARAILEFSHRALEMQELEERMAKLEAQLSAGEGEDGVIHIVRRGPDGSTHTHTVGDRDKELQ